MTIVWSGLAPHPPIIVASVGGPRCAECRPTIENMEALARDFIAHEPERLIVISPHTPRPRTGIGAWLDGRVRGGFFRFGAPDTHIELPVDQSFLDRFVRGYPQVANLKNEPLDHGAMVPLYFLVKAGWNGPTAVLGLTWDEDEEPDRIGNALREASGDDRRTAVLASGDMSHCLKPGAPSGYDERGKHFDDWFVAQIKVADYAAASAPDPKLKTAACQDVVESCRIAWRANDYRSDNYRFFGYEGPFGVGYSVMRFFGEVS